MLHVLLNMYSLPKYFCMTWYKKYLPEITTNSMLYSVKVSFRGDNTCDSVNSNMHESFLYFSTVCYVPVICSLSFVSS